MFIRLLITSIFFIAIVQSAVTNSSKGQPPTVTPILPKLASLYDDYDLNDKKTNTEGSGGTANLDEYADEDEENQLSKITATTIMSSTSTTTITTTIILEEKMKNETSTKSDDLVTDEFNEDYKDDLEDDIDYNEITTKTTIVSLSSTRPSPVVQHLTPIRVFFKFLTRPPIAAGILAG